MSEDPNADLVGYTYTAADESTKPPTKITYTVTGTSVNPQYVNVDAHYERSGRTHKTLRAANLVRQHKTIG
jgi:hypothetical protein